MNDVNIDFNGDGNDDKYTAEEVEGSDSTVYISEDGSDIAVDDDNDNLIDTMYSDTDGDGTLDTEYSDVNGDGIMDESQPFEE